MAAFTNRFTERLTRRVGYTALLNRRLATFQNTLYWRRLFDHLTVDKTVPSFQEGIAYLQDNGFVVSQFFPNNAGHFPVLIEFDCYAVNSRLLSGQRAITNPPDEGRTA